MRVEPPASSGPLGAALAALLLVLLLLPLLALLLSTSPPELAAGIAHPLFAPALRLSLQTSLISLGLTVLLGTPLAWWLSTASTPWARAASVLVQLPIVLPPAVLGVALLQTFGRQGLFGPTLQILSIQIPFTPAAVVLAQIVVSSPFFVQAAASAFQKVPPDLILVARTLGASPRGAFFRIALPIAWPGLIVGASLAWARSLGEFGATLLFAGNLSGSTQTLPLAIYTALEQDLGLAVVFSLALAAQGVVLLGAMQRFSQLAGQANPPMSREDP